MCLSGSMILLHSKYAVDSQTIAKLQLEVERGLDRTPHEASYLGFLA